MSEHGESEARRTSAWCDAARAFFRGGEPFLPPFLALYDEGILFQDPIRTVSGIAAFAEMNRHFMRSMREVDLEVGDRVEGESTSFTTWTLRVVPRLGPDVRVEGVTHLRFANSLITTHRDFFDLVGSMTDALPAPAGRIYRGLAGLFG